MGISFVRSPARSPFLAALTLSALAAGCGLPVGTTGEENGGDSPRCDDCSGDDGGPPAPPASEGTIVARLETTTTNQTEFILRGTVPVPPRTYPRVDGRDPFVVLDRDGTPLPTQTELVSRYANDADGADVVEVLAKVHSDPLLGPGSLVSYPVRLSPSPALPGPGTLDVEDLLATQSLPTNVVNLVRDLDGIEIATYDCFGHRYVCRPLDGTGTLKLEKRGKVQTELRVYQTMMPEPPIAGSSGTLPHSFGVHAYISTFTGAPMLGLDLRFHNGHSGRDTTTPRDNPLDKLYFREIEVSVPANWNLVQDFPDPFLGGHTTVGDRWVWKLVNPNVDGKMHVIRWQGQFHRRLILTQPGFTSAGLYAQGMGRAFCARGTDPVLSNEYWSWWNRGTARYFPQKVQLPSLDHVGRQFLRTQLFNDYNDIRAHLQNGSGLGDYPIQSNVLGWGHPYGVSYGGMTSGNEIFMTDGVSVAASASYPGYQHYVAVHRMQTDRMPTALYDLDGEPTSVERWLRENGNQDYVPFYAYLNPFLTGSYPDPFGFHAAPHFQIDYVQANALKPAYEGLHLGFDPHDFQHFIRYTRSAKVLSWLGNDSIAKDDLRMQAENFHLSFHEYRNDSFGGTQTSGLRNMKNQVAANPGKGCFFGRGEAWGVDCAVAAYGLAEPEWRAAKRPWLGSIVEMLLDGQGTCTGFLQAFVSDKAVNGLYRARQLIEQSITENTLQGLRESVFRGADPVHGAITRDVLTESLYAFVSEMSWFPGESGPWRYTGIGPLDISQPIWCSRSQMPGNAWSAGDTDTYQDWSSFAYGYELTGDPLFLDKAMQQMPFSPTLLFGMLNEGTDNVENRAALLALVQRREGLL